MHAGGIALPWYQTTESPRPSGQTCAAKSARSMRSGGSRREHCRDFITRIHRFQLDQGFGFQNGWTAIHRRTGGAAIILRSPREATRQCAAIASIRMLFGGGGQWLTRQAVGPWAARLCALSVPVTQRVQDTADPRVIAQSQDAEPVALLRLDRARGSRTSERRALGDVNELQARRIFDGFRTRSGIRGRCGSSCVHGNFLWHLNFCGWLHDCLPPGRPPLPPSTCRVRKSWWQDPSLEWQHDHARRLC